MIRALLQARTGSSRLPGKVLMPLLGEPMLARQIERILRANLVDELVIATSDKPGDDPVAELGVALGVQVHRGSEADVLERMAGAGEGAEHVIRLTGDCPLTDPALIDLVVARHLKEGADITSNAIERSYPDGLDVEVIRGACFQEARQEATDDYEREHVTPFLYRRAERYRHVPVVGAEDLAQLRWTVDHAEDLEVVRRVFARLYPDDPAFGWERVLELQRSEPDLFAQNAHLA